MINKFFLSTLFTKQIDVINPTKTIPRERRDFDRMMKKDAEIPSLTHYQPDKYLYWDKNVKYENFVKGFSWI